MIVSDDRGDEVAVCLLDEFGEPLNERILPGQSAKGMFLRGYFTG